MSSSSSVLVVDLGNTRLKWALSGETAWLPQAFIVDETHIDELLNDAWSHLPKPRSIAMVSVGQPTASAKVNQWIEQKWSVPIHHVVAQPELLGVHNQYDPPESLGADRWAGLIGARGQVTTGACVIDCGTAVTLDVLTTDGDFAGGVILPGLALARSALLRGTAGINMADGNDVSCLARNTADAVAAGTTFAIVGAIERIIDEFEQALEEPLELLITGGDADRIATRLRRSMRRVPDLVLRGLARIAESVP